MYANEPEMAKRWEKETPKGKLPARKGEVSRVMAGHGERHGKCKGKLYPGCGK
jgi:hypothetical protein